FELLDRAVDQGAVRPRAIVCDIKVVASRFGLEAGGAVGGDAVAEAAVDALELAVGRIFDRQLFVAPLTGGLHAHVALPSTLADPQRRELMRHNLLVSNLFLENTDIARELVHAVDKCA